jgi:hypothetical protein
VLHDSSNQENTNNEAFLAIDREDLLAILNLRFGDVPSSIQENINAISKGSTLERLITVAANAASWDIFVSELLHGKESFKILGEAFNPLANAEGGV